MKNKMLVLAAFLAAAGCAHQAVQPGSSGSSNSGNGSNAQTGGASSMSSNGQAMANNAAERATTIHFAFDSSAISGEDRAIVKANAEYMLAHKDAHVRLEGNCDERGTEQYNLALGWRRAKAVKGLMEVMGVPASRLATVSYGKDHPVALGHDEAAWAKNRRVDFDYKH